MADFPPTSELRPARDAQFNAIIVEGLACGVYTLLLSLALWKLHRKAPKGFYFFALITLWISVIIKFACDWVTIRSAFVINNSSPRDIDIALNGTWRILIIMDTSAAICVIISDAILVWRCHVMWHNRFILIALITLLWLAICSDVPRALQGGKNYLLGFFAQLASLMTTAAATSLIALKIIRVTRKSQMHYSYTKIVQILVESAALVSIVGLGVAAVSLAGYIRGYDFSTANARLRYQLLQYLAAVQSPVMGIGPTLIAFRVAEEKSEKNDHATSTRINPLSRLTFRRTAPDSNADSQAQHTRASSSRFGVAHRGRQTDCIQSYMDIEAQADSLNQETEATEKSEH